MAGFNFGGLFQPKAPAPAPAQPLAPTAPGSTMQQANPDAGTPQAPQNSPLEQYKDLWKTNDTQGQQPADPLAAPLFNTDTAKLREAVQKTDFTAGVPAEVMQKVMQGGDPQALVSLINHVAQQSLSMSLQLGTTLQEQAGQTLTKRWSEGLSSKIDDHTLRTQAPSNPVLSNPAAEGMLRMARNQFRMQHPDKSPTEINRMAEQYLTDFASSLAPGNKPSSGESSSQQQGTDWEAWINS